jgi:hypothetical protein
LENWRNKLCVSFEMHTKGEQAILCWNPPAEMHPVRSSTSVHTVLTLPRRTFLHSTSSILAVHISCLVIALFVFRKPSFIN